LIKTQDILPIDDNKTLLFHILPFLLLRKKTVILKQEDKGYKQGYRLKDLKLLLAI